MCVCVCNISQMSLATTERNLFFQIRNYFLNSNYYIKCITKLNTEAKVCYAANFHLLLILPNIYNSAFYFFFIHLFISDKIVIARFVVSFQFYIGNFECGDQVSICQ